jgi:hypothetical protein
MPTSQVRRFHLESSSTYRDQKKSRFGSSNGGGGNLDLGHLNSDLESESEARNPFMAKLPISCLMFVLLFVPSFERQPTPTYVHNIFPIIASGTTAAAGQRLQPNKNSNSILFYSYSIYPPFLEHVTFYFRAVF